MRASCRMIEASLAPPASPIPIHAALRSNVYAAAIESTTPLRNQGLAIASDLEATIIAIEIPNILFESESTILITSAFAISLLDLYKKEYGSILELAAIIKVYELPTFWVCQTLV